MLGRLVKFWVGGVRVGRIVDGSPVVAGRLRWMEEHVKGRGCKGFLKGGAGRGRSVYEWGMYNYGNHLTPGPAEVRSTLRS